MAMSIGGKRRADKLNEDDWRDFVGIFSLSEEKLERFTFVAEAVAVSVPNVLETHKDLYKDTTVPGTIAKRALERSTEVKIAADRLGETRGP